MLPAEIDTNDTDATTMPDHSQPWVQRLMKLTPDAVLSEARQGWATLKQSAWTFAFLVTRIKREGLFRPYDSLTEWARHELGKDSGAVSKYLQAGEFVLSLEDETEREQVMSTPPATLAEAGVHRLAKTDRPEAIRLAAAGMTQRELVQAVRAREAGDQHLDTGPLKTFRLLLNEPAHRALLGIWHLVRFQCESPRPPDNEIAELLARDYRNSVQIQPEALRRIGYVALSQGWIANEVGQLEQVFAQAGEGLDVDEIEDLGFQYILAGRVVCIECGASNPNDLEGNHVFPKGHQGHDGPMVFECRMHHQAFHEAWEAHWKQHVRRWMNRADLAWFKAAAEHWLNGRALEGV